MIYTPQTFALTLFYEELKGTLILTDDNGQQWVTLTKHCDTRQKNLKLEKLSVWSWLYAYFMTQEQADEFAKCAGQGLPIISASIASHHQTYTIFNREYPWSPSCRKFEEYAWEDARLKTGEVETITEAVCNPCPSIIDELLRECEEILAEDDIPDGVVSLDEDDNQGYLKELAKENKEITELHQIQYREKTRQREAEKGIGRILHATTNLLWEEEYDATKEGTITQSFPCGKLIEVMGLRQFESDGFFYDYEGKLAAFDMDRTQNINGVVVRKDVLDSFLSKTELKLVWLVDAEKQIHAEDHSISSWSDWEAVYIYEGDHIIGDIHRLPEENRW